MTKQKKKKKEKQQAAEAAIAQDAAVLIDAPAPENGRSQKRAERRRVVNEDLQLELTTLRQTVNEMLSRFQLKLDAELVQLAEAASGNGAFDGERRRLPVATAEAMLEQIRGLEVKASKGRAKDFQRVQDLVGNLIEQLPAEK